MFFLSRALVDILFAGMDSLEWAILAEGIIGNISVELV